MVKLAWIPCLACIIGVLAGASLPALAATTIPGRTLTADETWTPDGNPYLILGGTRRKVGGMTKRVKRATWARSALHRQRPELVCVREQSTARSPRSAWTEASKSALGLVVY
jgi:hypothetical protein